MFFLFLSIRIRGNKDKKKRQITVCGALWCCADLSILERRQHFCCGSHYDLAFFVHENMEESWKLATVSFSKPKEQRNERTGKKVSKWLSVLSFIIAYLSTRKITPCYLRVVCRCCCFLFLSTFDAIFDEDDTQMNDSKNGKLCQKGNRKRSFFKDRI